MKKIIITASCIAVLTLFAVILVSEKGETIAKKDAITVDNNYSVEEKTVYKVISESLDVSYIHSNDEKREDSNVIVEQNDEVLSDNEEMQKTESGEICKVEDITEDAAGLDDLTIIDETQSATSEVEVFQLELAIGDDVSKVEASTEFQYDSSDGQDVDDFELAIVSSVSPAAEISVAEVPAIPGGEKTDEENPIEIIGLEPVISIELPVVRDVKK